MKKNQKGFGVVETLLILVILGLIGFSGWYVWHVKQTTDKNLAYNNSSTPTTSTIKTDLLAGGTTYTAPDKSFSVTYPKGWLTKECPITQTSGAYLGLALAVDGLLQDCNAQPKPIYGSVVHFQSYAAPSGFDNSKDSDGYNSIDHQPFAYESSYTHTKVQLNGKTVDKQVSVHKTGAESDPLMGATVTTYHYFDGTKLWFAVYTNLAGSKDSTDYFNAMVNTWKF